MISWMESSFGIPSYAWWVLLLLALCFLGAASNTMAGWLYLISSFILSLLFLSVLQARRALVKLRPIRFYASPVHAGDILTIAIGIQNNQSTPARLLEVHDFPVKQLSDPVKSSIKSIDPYSQFLWKYNISTFKRGIYHWSKLKLRCAFPLGLFWGSRTEKIDFQVMIYPQVLQLSQCPIVDLLSYSNRQNSQLFKQSLYHKAPEGITRNLRTYRFGDPTRLIHWRSSARFSQFKIRELESSSSNQDLIIGLDTNFSWHKEHFEQAIVAAVSLYNYAQNKQLEVNFWLNGFGILRSYQMVLETLATVEAKPTSSNLEFPQSNGNLIWLTQNHLTLSKISGKWIFFGPLESSVRLDGLVIDCQQPLIKQLQSNPIN